MLLFARDWFNPGYVDSAVLSQLRVVLLECMIQALLLVRGLASGKGKHTSEHGWLENCISDEVARLLEV